LLTLSKQQLYLLWDTVTQSTKRQDTLEIFGGIATLPPLATPMRKTTWQKTQSREYKRSNLQQKMCLK